MTLLRVAPSSRASVRIERLAELDGAAPMAVAEALRGWPGMALLESARPGRRTRWSYLVADPRAVIEAPGPAGDPFGPARTQLSRLASDRASVAHGPAFAGGLVGFVGYEVRSVLERATFSATDDQALPLLRLALHDWALAFDRQTGAAWLAGRALDGDVAGLDRRLEVVADQIREAGARHRDAASGEGLPDDLRFVSGITRRAYLAAVEDIRIAIARGEIYQANLARRLETAFSGDPWLLYRRVRTGDPAQLAAYVDLGPAPDGTSRAIVSASPEPFLAVDRDGRVATDPIKGTRPRGETPAADRALARELLTSAKDRAENVMIVDVVRNDLGRVCRPGSVRVARLCRLERTARVQHLVSTVTGRLASDSDAFDLLAAAFPGGSITGAPKIRAMEIIDRIEPVRRGPYTGALGWFGPDGAMTTSILIRTFVADGRRLSLHVGGGITWRSDAEAEWDETVAKARGPLAAIGATEVVVA